MPLTPREEDPLSNVAGPEEPTPVVSLERRRRKPDPVETPTPVEMLISPPDPVEEELDPAAIITDPPSP